MLSDSGGWWRDTAQRLLVERADRFRSGGAKELTEAGRSVVAALTAKAADQKDWRTRLRALWTLDGMDAIEPATVARALEDPSRDVRVAAVRLAERWFGDPASPIRAAVLERLTDDDYAVRQQLAASLGAMPPGDRDGAVVTLLDRHADDPITLDAALSGLHGSEADVLGRLLASDAETTQRDAAVTMLAATIVRSSEDGAIERLFDWTGAASRPAWQRARFCAVRKSRCWVRRCRERRRRVPVRLPRGRHARPAPAAGQGPADRMPTRRKKTSRAQVSAQAAESAPSCA